MASYNPNNPMYIGSRAQV